MGESETPRSLYAGIIGNTCAAALVTRGGSIDWCCMPFIQSPSIFSAHIDPQRGGYFRIRPDEPFTSYQHYIRATNVLETAFRGNNGTVILTDFMPIHESGEEIVNPEIIRIIRCCVGDMDIEIDFYPRCNYGKGWNKLSEVPGGILVRNYDETAILASDLAFAINDGHARVKLPLKQGNEIVLALSYGVFSPSKMLQQGLDKLNHAVRLWREWAHIGDVSSGLFKADAHESVVRSGLFLKLLSHPQKHLAAEAPSVIISSSSDQVSIIDGRLAWMPGQYAVLLAWATMGYKTEADNLAQSLCHCAGRYAGNEPCRTVLLADGRERGPEAEIPITAKDGTVRAVKTEAEPEKQQGCYAIGFIVEALYEYTRITQQPMTPVFWECVVSLVNKAVKTWDQPDTDYWRLSREKKHFVFSKIMCWVAIDRGLKLASAADTAGTDRTLWTETAQLIHDDIIKNGYNAEQESLVRSYDSSALDATCLLLPRLGFLSVHDDLLKSTIKRVQEQLIGKNYLVRPYTEAPQGFENVLAGFWFADCVARMGNKEKAQEIFALLIAQASPLGLLPALIDVESKAFKGHFPHAYTHAEMILTAYYISS